MKGLFIVDGNNFLTGFRYSNFADLNVDYQSLEKHVMEMADVDVSLGTRFHIGEPTKEEQLTSWGKKRMRLLGRLDHTMGFIVRRYKKVSRERKCSACGIYHTYTAEKQVDTAIVTEMMHMAATNSFDVLILASGDGDFVPAVKALLSLGKIVLIATWGVSATSPDLLREASGFLHLGKTMPHKFLSSRTPFEEDSLIAVLDELARMRIYASHWTDEAIDRELFCNRTDLNEEIPKALIDRQLIIEELLRRRAISLAEDSYSGNDLIICDKWCGVSLDNIRFAVTLLDSGIEQIGDNNEVSEELFIAFWTEKKVGYTSNEQKQAIRAAANLKVIKEEKRDDDRYYSPL